VYLLAKYNTQTDFYFPMVKRGVVDLAVSADWTPATGDTKVSKDGGAVANSTNNPAIASGTSWKLTLTASELSAKWVTVQIVDSATKAVEDQFLTVLTYGNASAFFIAPDYQDATAFGLSRLDAAITSRMATFTLPTNFSALAIDGSGRVTVGSIVNGAIAAATFAANALGAVWDELRSAHTTASTFGQGAASVQGNVTGSVGSVTGSVGSVTGAVGSVTGAVGSVTGNVGGSVGSVASAGISATSFAAGAIDSSAFAQSAADKIWSSATRTLTSFGTLASDVWAVGTRTLTSFGTLVASIWSEPMAGYTTTGSAGKDLATASAAVGADPATIAAAVWDINMAAHTTGGTTGAKLNSLSGAAGGGSTTVTLSTSPITDGAELWVTADGNPASSRIAQCTTGSDGTCKVNLDPGTYYLCGQHGGFGSGGCIAFTV
jgi:hypothetical protein